MVAAVAATMASASMADISIKGDAYLQYADQGIARSGSKTVNAKRVNLNVVGKSGSTTVVASFRTDDQNANRSGAIDADAIVAATAATINFFIIYSICCEKNLSKIAKMVLIIQVFIVKSTLLCKKNTKMVLYKVVVTLQIASVLT
jgi:hypothetical protein